MLYKRYWMIIYSSSSQAARIQREETLGTSKQTPGLRQCGFQCASGELLKTSSPSDFIHRPDAVNTDHTALI